jgi:anthranilate synthase component 1
VTSDDGLERIVSMMTEPLPQEYSFRIHGTELSSYSDDEFIACVENLQKSIAYGDIFQAVLSRRFSQAFEGDDFQVYRALRSINPSPYLYYYDLGYFRLFGSSPETALIVDGHKAILNPIAGTAPRTGDASLDQKRISQLLEDTKEASEHVMLVDLARNDLSRQCFPVSVDEFRSIHSYSHVTHLVSSVSGIRPAHVSATQIFFDVFPAGTVSGAPKYRAMELIDVQEPVARSFYGGAIGLYGFDGSCAHALTIRSILSKDNNLIYQAGAGIVSQSKAEYECNEINAKVAALRQAIIQGELICG